MENLMKTGISVYLGSGYEKNIAILKKAQDANISYAFTSLHIPEEKCEDYAKEARRLLEACRSYGLQLIMDVGPRTLEKLKVSTFDELADLNVTHIRLDYGFSLEETKELSKKFHIVSNASTLSWADIHQYQSNSFDTARMAACHNFYPKPLTGLSIEKVLKINQRLHMGGIATMAFVPGDLEKRGPLYEGLPTVEEHRSQEPILSMLQLRQAETDIVLVGDVDCMDDTYAKIGELSQGYLSLHADLKLGYEFLCDTIHHDRPDSSEYVIRSQESRGYASLGDYVACTDLEERHLGSISIGNENYLRYSGEVEIARMDLPSEQRVNIVGHIKEEDLKYLDYINDGFGFRLVTQG